MSTIPGVGPQLQDNGIRGWLTFEYLPPELQNAEDSTQAADYERWNGARASQFRYLHDGRKVFERPATDTERALLEHLGHELPEDLTTRVEWINGVVRRRAWPQIESETT